LTQGLIKTGNLFLVRLKQIGPSFPSAPFSYASFSSEKRYFLSQQEFQEDRFFQKRSNMD
jgi:hypothetical protein